MYEEYASIYHRSGQGAWSVRMAAWTLDWLTAHGIPLGRVADFGCGTGAAAQVFARAGATVVGVDCAPAMLALAPADLRITWLEADIRTVRLAEPVNLVVAFYDTLNYLLTVADLQAAWRAIGAALTPGGLAVVDVNLPAVYSAEWSDRDTITADTADLFVLNRLSYQALTQIGTGRILWFERDGAEWRKQEETHRQRAHTPDELMQAIRAAGLEVVAHTTPSGAPPDATTPRSIFVARKGD